MLELEVFDLKKKLYSTLLKTCIEMSKSRGWNKKFNKLNRFVTNLKMKKNILNKFYKKSHKNRKYY